MSTVDPNPYAIWESTRATTSGNYITPLIDSNTITTMGTTITAPAWIQQHYPPNAGQIIPPNHNPFGEFDYLILEKDVMKELADQQLPAETPSSCLKRVLAELAQQRIDLQRVIELIGVHRPGSCPI